MQWFQVTCPNCTSALQVKLPEGVTSVQCSQCKAVFAVQVQPVALTPPGSVPAVKRSRKRKKEGDEYGASTSKDQPRALSAYNVFMKGEVANVKAEHPELPHREAFKLVRATSTIHRPRLSASRGPRCSPPSMRARHPPKRPTLPTLSPPPTPQPSTRAPTAPRTRSHRSSPPLEFPTRASALSPPPHASPVPLACRVACVQAAERWQSSPMNPQNGGDRFPLKIPPNAMPAPNRAALAAGDGAAGGAVVANGTAPRAESAYDSGADGGLAAAAIEGGADEGGEGEEEEEDEGGEEDGAADGAAASAIDDAAPVPT